MSDYIGVRNLCSLCTYGKLKKEDKYGQLKTESIVCQNKKSNFYNLATAGILCAPCFRQKEIKEGTIVEYVGLGD